MPKKIWVILMLLVTVLLVACANNQDTNDKEENKEDKVSEELENDTKEEIEDEIDSDIKELFAKMKKEAESIESYSLESKETENVKHEDEELWESAFVSSIDVTFDPIAYKQKDSVIIPGLFYESHEDVDIVYTGEEYVIYNEEEDIWGKYPEESVAHMPEQIKSQYAMTSVVKEIEEGASEMELEEKEDYYSLQKTYDENSSNESEDAEGLSEIFNQEELEYLDMNYLKYEIKIDKETHRIKKVDTTLKFMLELEDKLVELERKTEIVYENYNEVPKINIDPFIVDKVVEVDP